MHSRPSSLFFAVLSAVAFLAALLILTLLLWQAESLVRLGLEGKLYYLILVPLGLAVAAFLFGILRSYAVYNGKALGRTLKLGGPVVAFVLVLILGFWLVPNPASFNVTVFVHQADTLKQPFLHGKVLLRLGGDPRTAAISEKGEAYFIGIPATFRDQRVAVQLLDTTGYEAAQSEIKLSGDGVQLAVLATPVVFRGYVKTLNGHPIPGALVSLAGHRVQADVGGYFALPVPGMQPESDATLQVAAPGYAPKSNHVIPGGNDITVMLEKAE